MNYRSVVRDLAAYCIQNRLEVLENETAPKPKIEEIETDSDCLIITNT